MENIRKSGAQRVDKLIAKSQNDSTDGFMNIIFTHRPVHARNLLRFSPITSAFGKYPVRI